MVGTAPVSSCSSPRWQECGIDAVSLRRLQLSDESTAHRTARGAEFEAKLDVSTASRLCISLCRGVIVLSWQDLHRYLSAARDSLGATLSSVRLITQQQLEGPVSRGTAAADSGESSDAKPADEHCSPITNSGDVTSTHSFIGEDETF